MRISDWSSDVCSSDLGVEGVLDHLDRVVTLLAVQLLGDLDRGFAIVIGGVDDPLTALERVDLVQTLRHARSEEHTSELQSLMSISYAVFCLKKTNTKHKSIRLNI